MAEVVRDTEEDLPFMYLCDDCANLLGGKWPLHHCATIHMAECPYCLREQGLACVDDYLWNDEKTLKNWD